MNAINTRTIFYDALTTPKYSRIIRLLYWSPPHRTQNDECALRVCANIIYSIRKGTRFFCTLLFPTSFYYKCIVYISCERARMKDEKNIYLLLCPKKHRMWIDGKGNCSMAMKKDFSHENDLLWVREQRAKREKKITYREYRWILLFQTSLFRNH